MEWSICNECKREVWRTINGRCEECLGIVTPLFPRKEEIALTFYVPETDFTMLAVEAALHWLAEKYATGTGFDWKNQHDRAGMRSAYSILLTIQHQYAEKLGKPEWKIPPLA
jgi:hypothetical protein